MNSITFNTIRTKQLNVELVKSALIELLSGTKKEIADLTGLSVATCGNILNELIESGEVIEIDMKETNGGRPARCFEYNPNCHLVACISLSSESKTKNLSYVVANMTCKIIEEASITVETIDFNAITGLIDLLINRYKIIQAIGIGVPGVVKDGIIVDECDIRELLNYPLEEHLKAKYDIKVVVENDMNLKALGFYKKQNYDDYKNIAVINFPSDNCIGSGIIVDGHILKGNTSFAGEVSYLPFVQMQANYSGIEDGRNQQIDSVVNTIVAIIAIINPETIALTGDLISPDMLENIITGCLQKIPTKHLPQIIIRENINDDYIYGLISVTVDSLSCEIKLVKKRL